MRHPPSQLLVFVADAMLHPMLCPNCGKESTNIRVCAHCQTPYPTNGGARGAKGYASHRSSGANASGSWMRALRARIAELPRGTRWAIIGLLAVSTAGYYVMGRERAVPVGVVVPNVIATSMSPTEAAAFLETVNTSAQVAVRGDTLLVRISAATFPQQRKGQLALAQQYTRADELVLGRRRAIHFFDPDGSRFASADPAQGVSMTR